MSSLRFKQVDVFTTKTFPGKHPVAVSLGVRMNLDTGMTMQQIRWAWTISTDLAGVTIFQKDGPARLHVRSFAPALGVPEDPVCGSGNASVAAYLIHTGSISGIGTDYTARQGMNVGRDGLVAVKVAGDEISIGGYAVTCVDGTLCVA